MAPLKLHWYKQTVPNNSYDWDLTQVSPLFRAKRGRAREPPSDDGGERRALRSLDRGTHEVVYSTAATTIKPADVPVTQEGVVACPGARALDHGTRNK